MEVYFRLALRMISGRLKKRFEGRLIQFRPSGVRVSKGDRHFPALVAMAKFQ